MYQQNFVAPQGPAGSHAVPNAEIVLGQTNNANDIRKANEQPGPYTGYPRFTIIYSVRVCALSALQTQVVELEKRLCSEAECKECNLSITEHRRGRGKRRNDAYWMDRNSKDDTDPFDARECLFSDENGNLRTPAMANLDSGLKVPGGLIMSPQFAKELGRYQDISQDFVDPRLQSSVSRHPTPVTGILRDVVFRLKGTSVTFKRDFFICDAIDGFVDIMFGASFMRDQFKLLFERPKECFSTFATWFSTKKESKKEKVERERRERDQKMMANQREIARLQKEQSTLQDAQMQSQEGAGNRQ